MVRFNIVQISDSHHMLIALIGNNMQNRTTVIKHLVEDTGLENAGNDIVWNTVYSLCLFSTAGYDHWVRLKGAAQCVFDRGQCRYVERLQWINKSSIGAARMSVRDNSARTDNAVERFHAAPRRCIKVAHPYNLYTFLGHLQRATADGETDIARLNNLKCQYVVQRNAPTWSTKHASRLAFPVSTGTTKRREYPYVFLLSFRL